MAKKISGSEIVIECLKEQGVDIVFGYPGGAILILSTYQPLVPLRLLHGFLMLP